MTVGSLVVGGGFATFVLVVVLAGRGRIHHHAITARGQEAIDLRRQHQSTWPLVFVSVWAVLSLVLAIALLVRGFILVGLGWLVIAGMWAVVVAAWRRTSRAVLRELGDRGNSPRPARFVARATIANRFGAVGVTGYVIARTVRLAFPDSTGVTADLVYVAGTAILVVGLAGFASIRFWMWWKADDLGA